MTLPRFPAIHNPARINPAQAQNDRIGENIFMTASREERKRLLYAQTSTDLELLDRVTVLRPWMQADAVDYYLAELARRGIGPDEIAMHERLLKPHIMKDANGMVATCHQCLRAAVHSYLGWHKLLHLFPIMKRRFYTCAEHKPSEPPGR